jgi:hypothetical protein
VSEVGAALAFGRVDGTLARWRHRRVHSWVL